MSRAREAILREIDREERRVEELLRAQAEATARIGVLRHELEGCVEVPPVHRVPRAGGAAVPWTSAEKVRVFRSLFYGRQDVFPTRFVSKRTGKPGYAPACSNKFQPGFCILKTGGKCSDCANQSFVPVSDQVILDHLQGKHIMGVYPLLSDETCRFLAADFDKSSWRDDVSAFVETCRSVGVPVAIERSRSGNGAHAWFFFREAVRSNVARKMGCYLITETMSRRHELTMDSYDRLFPNQDTMPRGGFGNLIALPLQHESRKAGNSVFVDEHFEPFADQWAFLASMPLLDTTLIESIAGEATRTGRVVGVRFAEETDQEEAAAPWTRLPSRLRLFERVQGPLPGQVKAVLSQRLFVEKAGLPSQLLNQLKRTAAFQNPEFYKKQKMRLSTAMTPRVVACFEDLPLFIALPRGCAPAVEALLRHNGTVLVVDDQRQGGAAFDVRFAGDLTVVQRDAARELLTHDTGVFVGPPGIGKTVLGTYLIAQRGRSTLVLVHRKPLLDQWIAQLAMFLGIDESEVGQIGGGKRKPNGRLDVAMIQSLVRKDRVDDVVAGYGHVIVDECHHLPAVSFERILSEVKARYLLGLTATLQRRDGHQPITEMQLGPVRFSVDTKSQAAHWPFDHRLIVRETCFRTADVADASIQEVYRSLANDEPRNARILDDVIAAIHEGRSPIVLTERKDHLDYLANRLARFVKHLVVLRGGMTAKEQRSAADQLASIPDSEERLVLATGRYVGEGFDDARLDTLFLAMPISWKGTLIQYSGRLHRRHPAKTEVRIYDYVDHEIPMLMRMFKKRLRAYRAIGYARGEAPLGFAEPFEEDRTVEYDPEGLHHFERDP